jgi:hypothetical protein
MGHYLGTTWDDSYEGMNAVGCKRCPNKCSSKKIRYIVKIWRNPLHHVQELKDFQPKAPIIYIHQTHDTTTHHPPRQVRRCRRANSGINTSLQAPSHASPAQSLDTSTQWPHQNPYQSMPPLFPYPSLG